MMDKVHGLINYKNVWFVEFRLDCMAHSMLARGRHTVLMSRSSFYSINGRLMNTIQPLVCPVLVTSPLRAVDARDTDLRVGPKLAQIGSKWDKSGTF